MAQLGWTFDPDNPVYEVYEKPEKKIYNWARCAGLSMEQDDSLP